MRSLSLEIRVRVDAPGKPKDPFSAALEALRAQLKNGRLVSGEPLTITDLAHDLGLSATPVREALSRLAGEGLIEDRRGRGYFAPRLDVSDLIELYGLRRLYLIEALAADSAPGGFPISDGPEGSPPVATQLSRTLDWIVARAGNRALFEAYRQVGERLAPSVRIEAEVFPLSEELAELQARRGNSVDLAVVVGRLHETRRQGAPELMRALRANANIASL